MYVNVCKCIIIFLQLPPAHLQTDDGWCEGTVKETGQRGMFPDNFVELFPAPKIQVQPPLPAQTKPPAPDIPIIRGTCIH